MLKKILKILGVVLLLLVVAFIGLIGPRNLIGFLRYDQRVKGTLKVGDPLPAVVLHALDGTTTFAVKDRVAGRPLVLIFGSFT